MKSSSLTKSLTVLAVVLGCCLAACTHTREFKKATPAVTATGCPTRPR